MIVHQAIGMKFVAELVHSRLQIGQEFLFVRFGKKDLLTGIPSGHDMVKCTGIFNSQWASQYNVLLTEETYQTFNPLSRLMSYV